MMDDIGWCLTILIVNQSDPFIRNTSHSLWLSNSIIMNHPVTSKAPGWEPTEASLQSVCWPGASPTTSGSWMDGGGSSPGFLMSTWTCMHVRACVNSIPENHVCVHMQTWYENNQNWEHIVPRLELCVRCTWIGPWPIWAPWKTFWKLRWHVANLCHISVVDWTDVPMANESQPYNTIKSWHPAVPMKSWHPAVPNMCWHQCLMPLGEKMINCERGHIEVISWKSLTLACKSPTLAWKSLTLPWSEWAPKWSKIDTKTEKNKL